MTDSPTDAHPNPDPTWRRWVTEGFVIVASILVAFALDAWWDGRMDERREHEVLTALADELASSEAELDSVMAYNADRVEVVRRFMTLTREDILTLPMESLERIGSAAGGGMTFDPSLGATTAIINGGLDLVGDVDLRASIAAWPGILAEIAVDQASMVARWERLADVEAELGYTEQFYLPLPADQPQDQSAREILVRYVFDSRVRGRIASLGRAISEMGEELDYVKLRLAALRSQVAAELEGGS